jgi:hypothetical protein
MLICHNISSAVLSRTRPALYGDNRANRERIPPGRREIMPE